MFWLVVGVSLWAAFLVGFMAGYGLAATADFRGQRRVDSDEMRRSWTYESRGVSTDERYRGGGLR